MDDLESKGSRMEVSSNHQRTQYPPSRNHTPLQHHVSHQISSSSLSSAAKMARAQQDVSVGLLITSVRNPLGSYIYKLVAHSIYSFTLSSTSNSCLSQLCSRNK